MYPSVAGYGDTDTETFESYYAKWPSVLSGIPKDVVREWIYRHWACFRDRWIPLSPHEWSYKLARFTSEQVLSIDHVLNWIRDLDAEGVEFVTGTPRSRTWVGQFMLANGVFPTPIIVAEHASHVICPRSGDRPMKAPLQLIEGHTRLACIRGMINAQHPTLRHEHLVWLVRIPGGAS